jgi:hypothetical protein
MMNVSERPVAEDDALISDAAEDSELTDEPAPPQSEVALQVPSLPGRSANIGHNSANPTDK